MPQTELTTSVTDLLIAVLALASALILSRRKTDKTRLRREWAAFFLFLGIASLMGALNHGLLPQGGMARRIFWIFLYAALFAATGSFAVPVTDSASEGEHPTKRETAVLYIAEAVMYVPTALLEWLRGFDMLFLFLIFGAFIGVVVVILVIKLLRDGNVLGRYLLAAAIAAVLALLVEFTKIGSFHLIWDFNHDGLTHLILMVSIVFIYFGASKSLE